MRPGDKPRKRAGDEVAWATREVNNRAFKTTAFRSWRVVDFELGGIKYAICETGDIDPITGEPIRIKAKITSYMPSEKESVRVLLHSGDLSLAEIVSSSSYGFGQETEE